MANVVVRNMFKHQIRNDLPFFDIGYTIRVGLRIVEGTKERIQYVEGIVIRKRNFKKRRNSELSGSINESFTIKCMYGNMGVERMFFINSPKIASIKITRYGKVRRAKLYYLRNRTGKANRVKEDLKAKTSNS